MSELHALPAITDLAALEATRRDWHAVAERVVAPAQFAATRHIGLETAPHGFGTHVFADPTSAERRIRVEGVNLVSERAGTTKWVMLATLRAAAALADVEPRTPDDWPYAPTTDPDPDRPLALDARSVALLGDWFAVGRAALGALVDDVDPTGAASITLWPEHFDLACDLGDEQAGTRGTFGTSPGDGAHPEPYLYVSRWVATGSDPFWNDAHFDGASLGYEAVRAAGDLDAQLAAALAFLRTGREVIQAAAG